MGSGSPAPSELLMPQWKPREQDHFREMDIAMGHMPQEVQAFQLRRDGAKYQQVQDHPRELDIAMGHMLQEVQAFQLRRDGAKYQQVQDHSRELDIAMGHIPQ